jgi:hypothetical protein
MNQETRPIQKDSFIINKLFTVPNALEHSSNSDDHVTFNALRNGVERAFTLIIC